MINRIGWDTRSQTRGWGSRLFTAPAHVRSQSLIGVGTAKSMRKQRYPEAKILLFLMLHECGLKIEDVTGEKGITESMIRRWKSEYGPVLPTEAMSHRETAAIERRLMRLAEEACAGLEKSFVEEGHRVAAAIADGTYVSPVPPGPPLNQETAELMRALFRPQSHAKAEALLRTITGGSPWIERWGPDEFHDFRIAALIASRGTLKGLREALDVALSSTRLLQKVAANVQRQNGGVMPKKGEPKYQKLECWWWKPVKRPATPEERKIICGQCRRELGAGSIAICHECDVKLHSRCYSHPGYAGYAPPDCGSCYRRTYSR